MMVEQMSFYAHPQASYAYAKSQHKTILADLNQYTIVIETLWLSLLILTDDAIKYMCIWPFM